MTTTIYVCTTCKTPDDPSPARAGARLYKSLQEAAQTHQSDVIIEGVECLSVCKRPCTIAFTDQNKWTYVYGDSPQMTPPNKFSPARRFTLMPLTALFPGKSAPTL